MLLLGANMWVWLHKSTPILLTFYLTVGPSGHHISLHYPTEVEGVEVCVYSEGDVERNDRPDEAWWAMSCWKPFYRIEDYPLREGTYAVWTTLLTSDRQLWTISRTNVRPR